MIAKNDDERTKLTLVFYLNDDCEGGELIFFPGGKSHSLVTKPDREEVVIKPKEGCGIMFFLYGENNFRHEGATILGKTPKYIIRSEIFYVRNQQDKEKEKKEKIVYKKVETPTVDIIAKKKSILPWIIVS